MLFRIFAYLQMFQNTLPSHKCRCFYCSKCTSSIPASTYLLFFLAAHFSSIKMCPFFKMLLSETVKHPSRFGLINVLCFNEGKRSGGQHVWPTSWLTFCTSLTMCSSLLALSVATSIQWSRDGFKMTSEMSPEISLPLVAPQLIPGLLCTSTFS